MAKEEKIETVKKHSIRNFLIILLITISALISWSRFISTKGLIVKEYAVINENLPASFHGIKIVHFGDLHYGTTMTDKEVKKLIQKINDLKADIVVFTGDLIDKGVKINDNDKDFLISELSKIDTTLGKFAVRGNHDYVNNNYDKIILDANFNLLINESKLVYYKGESPIQIIGLPSMIKDYQNFSKAFETQNEENYFSILLTHEPDIIDDVIFYNPNIILAGHSHGGQVRLPFVGAVILPNGAKKYYDEYYKVNETDLYITSGLGASTLNFRFMNKPSINLLRLYNH